VFRSFEGFPWVFFLYQLSLDFVVLPFDNDHVRDVFFAKFSLALFPFYLFFFLPPESRPV